MCLPLGASGADCNNKLFVKVIEEANHLHDTNLFFPVDKELVIRVVLQEGSTGSGGVADLHSFSLCSGIVQHNVACGRIQWGTKQQKRSNHRFSSWDKSLLAQCRAPRRSHFGQSSTTAPEEGVGMPFRKWKTYGTCPTSFDQRLHKVTL